MKTPIWVLTLCALCTTACDAPVEDKCYTGHSDSFVVEYRTFDALEVGCAMPGNILKLYLRGAAGPSKGTYSVLSEDAAMKELYKERCRRHGDSGFPFEFTYCFPRIPNSFPDKDFTAIEVVSDAEFDRTHPAGTDLGDLLLFCSASPWRFIRSGYAEKSDWGDDSIPQTIYHYFGIIPYDLENKEYYHPVYGTVDELTADDLILLGGDDRTRMGLIGVMTFMKEPDLYKVHTLTVTLVTEDGVRYSDTVAMEFP